MTYFYDEDICFTRLGFPHMLSASNAPRRNGQHSGGSLLLRKIQALYRIARGLDRTRSSGTCAAAAFSATTTRSCSARRCCCRYANVIFDLERAAALKTVHGYLDDLGIAYCGRYGDWGYMWTDESFKSGEGAVERALSRRRQTAAAV